MLPFTSCLGLLATLHFAASATQYPPVTQCSGSKDYPIKIVNVTADNAKLGEHLKLDVTALIQTTAGKNPVLRFSFSKPDGAVLPCVEEIAPCLLKLCGGTTLIEQLLNRNWDNSCPIQRGTYTSLLEFRLPDTQEAKDYFGDGNVEVTVEIFDNGKILGCAHYPLKIDVD